MSASNVSGTAVGSSPSLVGSSAAGSLNIMNANNNSANVAPSAVPTLKVMRIQAPELTSSNNSIHGSSVGNSMILPDSFGVIYIGERFCAYLGALNPSALTDIWNMQITVQLQTPSTRHVLQQDTSPSNIPPLCGVSSIVLQTLEEVGPHILRVEVSYGDKKTLRKFYRFTVSNPIQIQQLTTRHYNNSDGKTICHVSISVSHNSDNHTTTTDANNATPTATSLLLTQVHIDPPSIMTCRRIDPSNNNLTQNTNSSWNNHPHSISTTTTTATTTSGHVGNLLDQDGEEEEDDGSVDTHYTDTEKENPSKEDLAIWLQVGQTQQFLFQMETFQPIQEGDVLGKAMVTWKKAMGETGRIASTTIPCPPPSSSSSSLQNNKHTITVQVLNPPKTLPIGIPTPIQFYITTQLPQTPTHWQLQLDGTHGLVICGSSRSPILFDEDNTCTMTVCIMGTMSGFVAFGDKQTCSIVDTVNTYYQQTTPLFHTFIERPTN